MLLPRAIAQGLITQAGDRHRGAPHAALKFLAGVFEEPYADVKRAVAITDNAEARALALEAARKSVVLLKNDGVLPLRADGSRRSQSSGRMRRASTWAATRMCPIMSSRFSMASAPSWATVFAS